MDYGKTQFADTRVYHDLNSLANLKAKGKDNNPEAIREAAKQFESIFVGMMLKSMRDANAAIIGEPMLDSSQLNMYQNMHDEQLTLHLTGSGSAGSGSGLGLTDILVDQLSGISSTTKDGNRITSKEFNPRRVTRAQNIKDIDNNDQLLTSLLKPKQLSEPNKIIATNGDLEVKAPLLSATENNVIAPSSLIKAIEDDERGLDFSSPSAFVESLWPYAEKAAQALGLDPRVLISQAALETGWGKHVMRTEQGSSSKNLFGIKASKNWSGPKTQVQSLEVEAGTIKKKASEFRAYDSYADSFNDYTQFISNKSRYQKAMQVTHEPDKYVNELQNAGYATDPNYAKKISDIFNSSILKNALKSVVQLPSF